VAEVEAAYAAATRVIAFLVFPACLVMAATLPVALPMLYGADFSGAIPAAMVLVIAGAIGATSSVGTNLIMAMDRSDFLFLSGLIAAGLTVVAGLTVIPAFGLMGAVWARALVQAAAVALGGWFICCRLRFRLPLRELGKLLAAAFLSAAAARLCLAAVPGVLALPAAVAAGMAVYVAAVRRINALPGSDIAWLRAMAARLPVPLRRGVDLALWLVDGSSASSRGALRPLLPPTVTGVRSASDAD
jgi:O-antigen/teichoic acid export membrane protein